MALKKIADDIFCVDCDQIFNGINVSEGGQCPNIRCSSNSNMALGVVISQIDRINEKIPPELSVTRALSGLLPVRADHVDAQDPAVLSSLHSLLRVVTSAIAEIEAKIHNDHRTGPVKL